MLTRQEKIDTIYNKIARKDLDFGCIVESKYWESIYLDTRPWQLYNIYRPNYRITDKEKEMKIIGHPVMIGDIINWIENEWENKFPYRESAEEAGKLYSHMRDYFHNHISQLLNLWTKKQFPIEEQSDECIDFIYNLISK